MHGLWLLVLGGIVGVACCGCAKPLFPESAARSQYQRYSVLRGRGRIATERNTFGMEQPAIRERLRPLEEN